MITIIIFRPLLTGGTWEQYKLVSEFVGLLGIWKREVTTHGDFFSAPQRASFSLDLATDIARQLMGGSTQGMSRGLIWSEFSAR